MAVSNPHDKFFQDLFSRRQAAQDFLRNYLPPDITPLLDFDSLEISKDSFIDPSLRDQYSDILYQVTLLTGELIGIYILFEHKSYEDKMVAFQLLRYLVRIWEQQIKQQQPLQPIFPLVFYHGEYEWQIDRRFQGLWEGKIPASLQPYMIDFEYWLYDLSQYPASQIKGWVILQAGLRLLKYIWAADFGEQFQAAVRLLFELSDKERAMEYLDTMLRYAVSAAEYTSAEELRTIVEDMVTEGDELMPTIAEKWVEEGIEIGLLKGLEEGRQEGVEIGIRKGVEVGREEGRQEGEVEGQRAASVRLLRRFLAREFDLPLDHFDDPFAELDFEAITILSEAAFEVTTLAEFEALLEEVSPSDE